MVFNYIVSHSRLLKTTLILLEKAIMMKRPGLSFNGPRVENLGKFDYSRKKNTSLAQEYLVLPFILGEDITIKNETIII